ncbi:MAG: ABC transporter ATP-binding protein [Verrucomicrobiales bacterium]|nr:ABC transporter ATP-binding protein [Verrucomicrobiales bacterium]
MNAISCTDVSFGYGKVRVINDVSFEVQKGESIGVIGPNGGGKSTLLKLILGLESPETGTLDVLGQPAGKDRRKIGYVPQAMRFDPLYPVSVLEIVLMGRLDRLGVGAYSKECRLVAEEALETVRLSDFKNRTFSELSGGERQRVMIARALACEPELLLMDEPTANIDLSAEEQFIEALASLRKDMTLVLVTHDLELVSELSDSVLCVNQHAHRHSLPLSGETIREIYSGRRRVEHDRKTRHQQGDHSVCAHD